MKACIAKESKHINAASSRSSKPSFVVQTKLEAGHPNDVYEQEADAVADKVTRMPDPIFVQRKCAGCEKEEQEKVQRKSISPIQSKSEGNTAVSDTVASSIQSSKGKGSSLDANTNSFMSSRFGHDFSAVKIYTNNEAIQMNRELNAKAFTVGNDIYFNAGQYQPDSSSGKQLLAHELTHTLQQGNGVVRRAPMPKDAFGRPLGFFPTPEQEAYDRETYEIKEWEKVLERLKKGELDDRDLANYRLRNRLTGLTTTEINDLITKIKTYQQSNPAISTAKILEWLEVRKEISTPMPDGATVNRDPITNTIDSYSVTVNNIKITVLADKFGNTRNDTGPVTSFGRSYSWHAKNNIVDRLTDTTGGSNTSINPTSFELTIQTSYHDNPNAPSGYGKGTTQYDKEEKTTTLRVHEGKHGTDFINYISKHPFPVDISKGVVGVLTVAQMQSVDRYISGITKETCEATDQVGFSQDEFLKTAEGKLSGITSCRTH